MHLLAGRSLMMAGMTVTIRQAQGFVVGPRAGTVQQTGGCKVLNKGCRMSSAALPTRLNFSTLDAETAERKAERMWELADAEKPRALDSTDMTLSKEAGARLRESPRRSVTNALHAHEDDFIGDAERSALRRYQYSEVLDSDSDSVDDENEYYI